MALLFFERSVQPRLVFEQGKAGNVKRFDGLADPASIWMIEYRETGKGTMVRGTNDHDIPSHGRVWLDSSNGRVLQTEMISEDTDLRADITVVYKAESGLDLLVPGEMRETYEIRRNGIRKGKRGVFCFPLTGLHHDLPARPRRAAPVPRPSKVLCNRGRCPRTKTPRRHHQPRN